MRLSIYIKKRLLGDVITLLIVSGVIYLATNILNKDALNEAPREEMVLIDSALDKESA